VVVESLEERIMKEMNWIEQFNKDNLLSMANKLEEEKKNAQNKKNFGSITAKKTN
jgi:hypothetical protein